MGEPATIAMDARLSSDGQYRYWLARVWDRSTESVVFVMLNPSTADATVDDPTIRRCIGFAKAWGYGGLIVVNLFAYRATNPKELSPLPRRVAAGPDNDAAIIEAVTGRDVIVAWGALGTLYGRHLHVMALVLDHARSVAMLGKASGGQPRHPLYVHASQERLMLKPALSPDEGA